MAKSEFDEFVQNDVKKQKGVYMPVQASLAERLTTRHLPMEKLHPNPDDEFAFPDIGPNYQIISKYVEDIMTAYRMKLEPFDDDPIIVEKLHPEGYLILNGHHRWAAAMRMHLKKIRVKIVNLALESDIKKIIEKSEHNKRATLDLDEVVFKSEDKKGLEKPLGFPYNLRYKQRLRLGIPALFYALSKRGYDIWVYSSNYYSIDDIRDFFRCYHVYVDGIITGLAKKNAQTNKKSNKIEKLMSSKYGITLHIDDDMLLRTKKQTAEFEEYKLDVPPEEWAKKAITIIEEIERNEKKKQRRQDENIV
jgi:hypothetical protein